MSYRAPAPLDAPATDESPALVATVDVDTALDGAEAPTTTALADDSVDRAARQMVVLLVAAGGLASAANLISTVVVARSLLSVDYGALNKLLSLFLVLSMPGMALMVGVVRRVTAWELQGRGREALAWMSRAQRVGATVVVVMAASVWLARGPIVSAMGLRGPTGLVEVVSAGGVWVLVAMDRGMLQARRRYRALSANLLVEGGVRTAGMIVLTAGGLGLQGAAIGILAGELAAAVHARLAVIRTYRHDDTAAGLDRVADVLHTGRDLFTDVAVAMISLALLAALQNADVVVFGSRVPGRSGEYAAISVPAKALVFLALLLGNYLLPEASIRHRQGRHALNQLGHTVGLLALPALVLLLFAWMMPARFLGLVFGAKYEGGAHGFAPLVLSMALLCVTVVLTIYLLGTGWRWVVAPLAAGTALLVSLCLVAGRSLVATTHADLLVQAVLAATMVGAFVLRHRSPRTLPATRVLELRPAGSTTTPT